VGDLDLAPGLLVSMPHLADPNFSRAVVLMIEHDDDGSFGLIVNQPTELPVAELLEELEIAWRGDPDAMAWTGGPVMPTSGWLLHEPIAALSARSTDLQQGLADGATVEIATGLALSTSPDALSTIAASPPARTKFLLGYSGWGPGQLAEEVSRGSWLHADLDTATLFECPADEMWARALESIGVDPESIVPAFGVH
jgi:putative transcriptional regulator